MKERECLVCLFFIFIFIFIFFVVHGRKEREEREGGMVLFSSFFFVGRGGWVELCWESPLFFFFSFFSLCSGHVRNPVRVFPFNCS